MRGTINIFLILFSSLILYSCISSEETNYLQPIKISYPTVPYTQYKLKKGDVIVCSMSTKDEISLKRLNKLVNSSSGSGKSFLIQEDGTIIIPFFGTIVVEGYTIQEAEDKVEKTLKESILDIQIKISLINNTFIIYSNEKRGIYSVYKENMTIYQALAISGQTTERMDLSNVTILRVNDVGETTTKVFDLRSQDVIESEFYYIKPNDVIYFRTNKNAFYNITSVNSFVSTIQSTIGLLGTMLFVTSYK